MTTFTGHLTDAQAQRLVDGMLLGGETAEVEGHARGCLECEALVASYRALGDALGDLELPPLPADFTESVLARIETRERAAVRERTAALSILAAVVAAAVAVFALAGASAWAPTIARGADGLGAALRALRIGAGFVPEVVAALRVQIVLAAATVAIPLLVALSRLMPSPGTEVAWSHPLRDP